MTNGVLYTIDPEKYKIVIQKQNNLYIVGRCTCDNKDHVIICYCKDLDKAKIVMEALARYE